MSYKKLIDVIERFHRSQMGLGRVNHQIDGLVGHKVMLKYCCVVTNKTISEFTLSQVLCE